MRLELKLVEDNKRRASWYWFWWHIDDCNIKSMGNKSKNRQMGLKQTKEISSSKDNGQQSERVTHRMAENICKIASWKESYDKPSSVQLLSRVWLFVTSWTAAGFPVHHQLPELTQTHVHRVGDAIQPSYPVSSRSPPAFNLSQHQGLF